MKSRLVTVNDHGKRYQALKFCCPGCAAGGPEDYEGLHLLPVNAIEDIGKPSWNFNCNLELPTLAPSILTQGYVRCHSYLVEGVFEFLSDCEHELVGKMIPIPDLPDWALDLE